MSSFNLRRFSSPESLSTINPTHLTEFLRPHQTYLAARGFLLADGDPNGGIDYEKLVGVLMDPGSDTPQGLVDALYYVDEIATADGMDALIDAAREAGVVIPDADDLAPIDVAVQVWLQNSEVVQERHAAQFLVHVRSFEYFQCEDAEPPKPRALSEQIRRALERDLDDWFEQKKRGRGARVFLFPKHHEQWFLIRHGSPYRREGSINGGEPSSVHFRPLKFDVLVFDQQTGEIRINAVTKGEKELYRQKFGKHLFGSEEFFPGTSKYDLEPLRSIGEDALECGDVAGMEWARLREIQFYWGGAFSEIEIRKASDVLAANHARGRKFPERPRILRATFEIKFDNCPKTRTVAIKPPNVAQYVRDDDSVIIEEWLAKRGFIRGAERFNDVQPATAMAGA